MTYLVFDKKDATYRGYGKPVKRRLWIIECDKCTPIGIARIINKRYSVAELEKISNSLYADFKKRGICEPTSKALIHHLKITEGKI